MLNIDVVIDARKYSCARIVSEHSPLGFVILLGQVSLNHLERLVIYDRNTLVIVGVSCLHEHKFTIARVQLHWSPSLAVNDAENHIKIVRTQIHRLHIYALILYFIGIDAWILVVKDLYGAPDCIE